MIYITSRERFNAAHRLFKPEYSDERKLQVFGKCSNPNWHGHNYELFVTVAGTPDPVTGFVMDLKKLSKILKTKVIDLVDHKNINLDVEFMKGKIWLESKKDQGSSFYFSIPYEKVGITNK